VHTRNLFITLEKLNPSNGGQYSAKKTALHERIASLPEKKLRLLRFVSLIIFSRGFNINRLDSRLPEVKSDLPEKHAMARADEGFPSFDNVHGEQCLASLGKITLEYETGLWKLEDAVKGNN